MIPSKYITTQGDTWDMISFKLYEDEHYVDVLINANLAYREYVIFPSNIELIVPTISIQPISTLPPWKRGNNV